MRRRNSFNSRKLRLLVVLAVLSSAVIIFLFYIVGKNQIRIRATETLEDFAVNPWGEYTEISPEIYFVSTEDFGDESLSALEQEILAYYMQNEKKIPLEKVCHFASGRLEAYFFARAAGRVGERADGILLIFTDVSFSSDLMRTAVYIMAAVFLLLSALLYFAGRYTVRVLDEKDKGMKDFFANASHELKTPLMAIRSYAEGMKSGVTGQEKACAVIIKEADRMTGLVNAILEFSKLDSGTVQLHKAENDVREILYDAIQVIGQTAGQKGIEIIPRLPEPLLFICDEDMLFSAFSNILTNCVRYAESCITVEAFRQKSGALCVRISNDGKTISEQDAAHLFDRFYKGAGGQTGIGMALCREYIRLHEGTVEVSVRDGKTVFEVKI